MKVSFLVLLALKVMIYSGNTAHIIRTPVKQKLKSNALAYNITPDSSIASPPSEPYIVCPDGGFALDITPQTPDNVNISKSVPHCTALFPQSGEDKPSPESISPDVFSSHNLQFVRTLMLQFCLIRRRKFHFPCQKTKK